MAKGAVYYNGILAGIIEKTGSDSYVFTYTDDYYKNQQLPAISLSFPKNRQQFESKGLFPFFYGILALKESIKIFNAGY